jgi:hypothetical protein
VLTLRQDPFPASAVRDLLGIARALHRAWSAERAGAVERVKKLERIGRDLRTALDMGRKHDAGTLGHASAWKRAERATSELGELVDAFVPMRPAISATAEMVSPKRRR